MARMKRRIEGLSPELRRLLSTMDREDQMLVLAGSAAANFNPPETYCELLSDYENRPTRCKEPYDCGECSIFQYYYPEPWWLCAECISKQRAPETSNPLVKIDGHYQEGICSLCGSHSIVLVPIVEETDDAL